MIIRPEMSGDESEIFELTQQAFKPMPFSSGSEAPIINQLRKDGDLTVSLVAVKDNQIIGHITFSPITIDGESAGWLGLGPVSVLPSFQKQGIGGQLINQGLCIIKQHKAIGCALIGYPSYYSRFGFLSDGNLKYGDTPLPIMQWLSFGNEKAKGVLTFAPAFEADQ